MAQRRTPRGRDGRAVAPWRRVARDPLFGGAIAVLGFLILLWPLIRSPSMGIAAAEVFFFATWAAMIALLAGVARGLRPVSPRQHGDDHA